MISIQNYSNQVRFQGRTQNQQRHQANCQPEVAFNCRQEVSFNGGLKRLFEKWIRKPCQKFTAIMEEGGERPLPTAEQVAKERLIREAHHRDMQPGSTLAQIRSHDERVARKYEEINGHKKQY